MKYLKYIILVVIVIIIIIIALLLNVMNSDEHTSEVEFEVVNDVDKTVREVSNRNYYYIVKNIVENYYYDLCQFNMTEEDVLVLETDDDDGVINATISDDSLESERSAYKNKVYNYLSEEFISDNSVTVSNIQSKLGNYTDVAVLIDNVYFADMNENVRVYFVEGSAIEKSTLEEEEFSIVIFTDSSNGTFEIYPKGYDYKVNLGDDIAINVEEVSNRTYNKYTYNVIDDETYVTDMLDDYQNRLMYSLSSAYSRLNDEYRTAKFDDQEDFESYVEDKYYELINATATSYQETENDDYTQYLLIDRNGKYYIFRENTVMQYSLILDTYTIDIPEFTEKYNSVTDQEKVILNINKINLALNDGDYKYIYSKLADSFKSNYFSNYETYEKYMELVFFEDNDFDYVTFGSESGTYYTYEVEITDGTGTSSNTITKTFIMQLGDGTDFALSFNIQ